MGDKTRPKTAEDAPSKLCKADAYAWAAGYNAALQDLGMVDFEEEASDTDNGIFKRIMRISDMLNELKDEYALHLLENRK